MPGFSNEPVVYVSISDAAPEIVGASTGYEGVRGLSRNSHRGCEAYLSMEHL
jgi:hypothetical protein